MQSKSLDKHLKMETLCLFGYIPTIRMCIPSQCFGLSLTHGLCYSLNVLKTTFM